MFRRLGQFVSRAWPFLLVAWVVLVIGLRATMPDLSSVMQDGEFAFLPPDSPSRVSDALFREAWGNPLASSVVIVVRHESHLGGLTEQDWKFIDETLRPRLEEIVEEELAAVGVIAGQQEEATPNDDASDHSSGIRVHTFSDRSIGRLLVSDDNKASLVRIELTTEFLDQRNAPLIARIERLTANDGELHQQGLVPPGLHLDISGSATVGRDMIRAAAESARATELWTILLVVSLLVLIYRSPLLAVIPLLTVFLAVETAVAVLAHLTAAGILGMFRGIQIYMTVLCYGAGVDYCLFLIARYKEELDSGATVAESVSSALAKAGAAVTASAGTVICGIGMMSFAEFGKFRQAGHGITVGLFIVLLTALTFAPALLCMAGRWAFWPYIGRERLAATSGWVSANSLIGKILDRNYGALIWDKVGQVVLRRPGTVLLSCVALMAPFAVVAAVFFTHLSYGLLSDLPQDFASVQGAHAVQNHFPAGMAGEVIVLLKASDLDFASNEGNDFVRELTDKLLAQTDDLHLADIRTLSRPFGSKGSEASAGDGSASSSSAGDEGELSVLKKLGKAGQAAEVRIRRKKISAHYVSTKEPLKGHVTRLDFVLRDDPFSRNSISQFERLIQTVRKELPDGMKLYAIGPTADIRDLKTVTDRDQIRIDLLVILGVFIILVWLLRRPAISFYLILTVFFSYLVTLGVTFVAFYAWDPAAFAGLDWKVPMFLFTILIAVGEDYNIFLMARIEEEQRTHGSVKGIIVALRKTGSIISSCGIIMAGTFSSLLAGSLRGMDQLGFALAFGVLLDTFVVRPVLVPAYLVLLNSGRLGTLGRLLGAATETGKTVAKSGDA